MKSHLEEGPLYLALLIHLAAILQPQVRIPSNLYGHSSIYIVKIETLLLQWEKNEINAKEAPSALGTPYNL